jgi:sugar phosphate isomerase/epimerase
MKGLGVFPVFIPDLPAEEKYRLIKDIGFEAVNIYWGDEDKYAQLRMAKELGLIIDNIHSQNDNANEIWLEGVDGENRQRVLISCIKDCASHNIPTVVIHLTGFPPYPPVSDIGLKRIEELVNLAEQKNIKLAFENLWTFEHLDAVLAQFPSPNVGFCYDIGHENLNLHKDCLVSYGDRIFALHINDNFADGYDAHVLPFDGVINWDKKMAQLKQCKNVDYLTVEIYQLHSGKHEKSCIYKNISAEEFLTLAYKRATKLFLS